MDYVLEEKGLKKDNDEGVKMYEEYVKQRNIFIYNTVKVEDDDVIKYDYDVLQGLELVMSFRGLARREHGVEALPRWSVQRALKSCRVE